jgi:hypothetical protein
MLGAILFRTAKSFSSFSVISGVHATGTETGVESIPKPDAISLQQVQLVPIRQAINALAQCRSDQLAKVIAGIRIVLPSGNGPVARKCPQDEDFSVLVHDWRKTTLSPR